MARQDRRKKGGRVTPAGGTGGVAPARRAVRAHAHEAPEVVSSRYTPPIPQSYKVSPMWVPVLMFGLLGIGAVVIFLNYLGLLPGDTDNKYLLLGLGFVLGGIITATQLH